jgi:hypothetical protein
MATKGQIFKLRQISVDGVIVNGAVGAAKLLGVTSTTIYKALKYGYLCKGCVIKVVKVII